MASFLTEGFLAGRKTGGSRGAEPGKDRMHMRRQFESREARRRRRRRQRILVLVGAALLMVLIVALIVFIIVRAVTGTSQPGDASSQTSSVSSEAPAETTTEPTTPPTTTAPPASTVDADWFADAVFIGDSRTEGLMLYTGLEADALANKGMTVSTALTADLVQLENGEMGTVIEGLAQKTYGKVYIMLGVNELGWQYSSIFKDRYSDVIDAIKEAEPQATIYVQSILPVTKERSDSHEYQTKAKVDEYNRLIQEMCAEKGVTYLKVEDAVMTEDGYMTPEYAANDGVHLNSDGCLKWLEYLKEHH